MTPGSPIDVSGGATGGGGFVMAVEYVDVLVLPPSPWSRYVTAPAPTNAVSGEYVTTAPLSSKRPAAVVTTVAALPPASTSVAEPPSGTLSVTAWGAPPPGPAVCRGNATAHPCAGSGRPFAGTKANASAQDAGEAWCAPCTITSTAAAACGGAVAVIWVSETTVTCVDAVPPKLTPIAPANREPVMVTTVPPATGPNFVEMADTSGPGWGVADAVAAAPRPIALRARTVNV